MLQILFAYPVLVVVTFLFRFVYEFNILSIFIVNVIHLCIHFITVHHHYKVIIIIIKSGHQFVTVLFNLF